MFRKGACWKIIPVAATSFSGFVRSLKCLGLEDSFLYIEGGGAAPPKLHSYLKENNVAESLRISGGTILPRPTIYSVPLTCGKIEEIATIAENIPSPIGSVHIHVYRDQEILLQWFDAFLDPIWASIGIPEPNIKEFSEELGYSYARASR